MKRSLKTTLTALLLIIVMIFSVSCINTKNTQTEPENETSYPANGVEKIIPQTRTLYLTSTSYRDLTLAHYESTPEILLADTATICSEFIDKVLRERATYTYEETDTTLKLTRENGAYCLIDFVSDTIYYNNFDLFTAIRPDSSADILGYPYLDSEGNNIYFKPTGSLDIAGKPFCIDLGTRNIPLDIYDGKKYMPVQTFSDIFLSPFIINLGYNGTDLFRVIDGKLDSSLKDLYYSMEPTERSEALAEFCAKELALVFDLFYGLADEHAMYGGFENYTKQIGLWDDLTSPDALKSVAAIASLSYGYIADKHMGCYMVSPYSGNVNLDRSQVVFDKSYLNFWDYTDALQAVRAKVMPDGAPGYEEHGNTAYITFDSFTIEENIRKIGYNEKSKDNVDTFGLIIYAHEQITRENSPIENVVIDLSCNTGGAVDSAVYLVSWMLGYCDLHIKNPITNGAATASFVADVNLDGMFDKSDTIADKNLYCITSKTSFSASNLTASLLKESGKVTILGDRSGGGACAVQFMTAADGSMFAISSTRCFSEVINGAYYSVDKGIEPHHHITKFENLYNRVALTNYINNLI